MTILTHSIDFLLHFLLLLFLLFLLLLLLLLLLNRFQPPGLRKSM